MKATEPQSISWNMVVKNLDVHEFLRKKVQQKIAKLERHLRHFPTDAVHLQVTLERHPKRTEHTAALTLRLPSNILRSQKTAPDAIKALDDAVRALLRELGTLKSALRREPLWKRKARREQLHELKTTRFTPQPMSEGSGPQHFGDIVRDLFARHYRRLVRHARRLIRHDELAGDLPPGAIEPRDVVDEVLRVAMTNGDRKPEESGWLVWFYQLVRQELRRQKRALNAGGTAAVSLDEPRRLVEDVEAAAGYDPERPLDLVEKALEPPVVRAADLAPDPHTAPPDQLVGESDLLKFLQQSIQTWPHEEREVFELHFVEGFEPDEIAMITGQSLKKTRELIASAQNRLREVLLQEGAL